MTVGSARLATLVSRSAERTPDRLAVAGGHSRLSYRELDLAANRIAHLLEGLGARRGDRVGVWAEKSPLTVAAMQAVLRVGGAYVPIDPLSPEARALRIVEDCRLRVLFTTADRAAALPAGAGLRCVVMDELADGLEGGPSAPVDVGAGGDELAYILYTSGSTGRPKGVCISHRNALAFIEWAVSALDARETDRFANHAPFSFDLSVLDLYAAFAVGGAVSLISEGAAYSATGLVEFVAQARPTVWYSVPSALILMMDHGGMLELADLPMRAILFAGEPFPVKHVRRLRDRWPDVRLLNLYGPTETNVCTFHEVGAVDPERTRPVPIGRACSGDTVWAAREDGSRAEPGEEGVLMVEGPTVMVGYWGHPPHGAGPYVTGDLVRQNPDGDYEYVGRRDGMVKVRGFRIELGEIEAALAAHGAIRDAAVVVTGAGVEARLTAVAVGDPAEARPTLLEVKRHCADRLPRYMIVDRLRWLDALPRSANGKIDRKKIAQDLEEASKT